MWQSILSLFWRQTPKTLQRACVIRRSLLPGELGSGVSREGPPLFLDETEARRVENIFFQTTTPPPPYLKVWIRYCLESPVSVTERKNHYHAACLSLPGKRTYTMLARVQQSYETRSYDFKIKYWDDFDTRLEWLKNSDLQNIAMSHNKTDQRICRLSFKLKSWLVVADFLKKHKHIVG